MYQVEQLFIYPIKSLRGIAVSSIAVTPTGFEMDRLMMLVDENGRFISQREHPQLCAFEVSLDFKTKMVNVTKSNETIEILGYPTHHLQNCSVTIWDDEVEALVAEPTINQWFSKWLQVKVRLVYLPNKQARSVTLPVSQINVPVSFADAYPILLIGQESLKLLQSKVNLAIEMERFRPNLTFTGGKPHGEDDWKNIQINQVDFSIIKPCARCNVTTLHPITGLSTDEPLKTLSTYRKVGHKILFGQNTIPKSFGTIKVGDSILVTVE